MNTCNSCKWWGKGFPDTPQRECDNPKLNERSDDGATAWVFEGDSGVFITGPRFGCTHWQHDLDAARQEFLNRNPDKHMEF